MTIERELDRAAAGLKDLERRIPYRPWEPPGSGRRIMTAVAAATLVAVAIGVPVVLSRSAAEPVGQSAPPAATETTPIDPVGNPDDFLPFALRHPDWQLWTVMDDRYRGGSFLITYRLYENGSPISEGGIYMGHDLELPWEGLPDPDVPPRVIIETQVEVHGRAATLYEEANLAGVMRPRGLKWTTAHGFEVFFGAGVWTSEELLELAEFLKPMTPEEWESLRPTRD